MRIDLRLNYPVLEEQAALLQNILRHTTAEVLTGGLILAPFGGRDADREVAAQWLSKPGYPSVSAERIFISGGGHHSLVVCLLAAQLTGAAIAVEPLTYSGFLALQDSFSLRMIACAADEHGLMPEALRAACRHDAGLRAVYLMPTVHNPLGTVMPAWRREEIIAVARERNLLIIEDDAYGFLEANPPPGFALLAPERTCYFLSLSKPFAPGVKTAFITVPERLAPAAEAAIRRTVSGASPLLAGLVSRLMTDGTLERVILAKRADAAHRQRLARGILDGVAVQGHPGSYHLWLTVGEAFSADAICEALERDGIDTTPAKLFAAGKTAVPNAFRIALGQERDEKRLTYALEEIARRCRAATG